MDDKFGESPAAANDGNREADEFEAGQVLGAGGGSREGGKTTISFENIAESKYN